MPQPARHVKELGVQQFRHPAAGTARRASEYLAIFWRNDAQPEARTSLLEELGLELARLATKEQTLLRVNQTQRLSWVRSANGKDIRSDTIAKLAASELVEWVSPGYRSERQGNNELGLFTVNPTRFYVRQQAFDQVGGVSALPAAISVDAARSNRLHGLVALATPDMNAIEIAEQLQRMPGIAPAGEVRYETIPFVSPTCDALVCRPPTTDYLPDDPMFTQQWGLQRIGAPRGWQIARGSSQIAVAVIDEGVQLDHPDLLLHPQSWNATSDTPDGSPVGNHGTACAGIIGARLDNGAGVAGVAGGVRIMAIATATWADVDVAEGLYFAADNGARVGSMSFGVYESWGVWDFDLIRDALQYAHAKGLLLVAASGNENASIARFPGSDARTLCVGGCNRSDERKRVGDSSSESWWGACYGPDIDVVAPCVEIPTTNRLAGQGYSPGDYYERFNGTSAATPHVAGLAALIFSLKPSLTNVQVRALIESTCDKISPSLYPYAHVPSKPNGTWHEEVGYGRINVERALLAACALEGSDDKSCTECAGCGGTCEQERSAACRSPAPVPWLAHDRCQFFYESRLFDLGTFQDRLRLQVRITYQHCLKLIGRQQGPLLYTTTLLPGEELKIYEFDRYRRVRSASERVSVHASFRQTLSALSQARRATSASAYSELLTDIRTHADTSVSAGGGLAGFLGAPKVSGSVEQDLQTTIASGASVHTVSEQFTQLATTASQAIEAERAIVVSSFEDEEHRATTARTFKNHNHCYAVTYFVRRVNELYEASTRVESVEWRLGDAPWRTFDDLEDVPDALRKQFLQLARVLPKKGETTVDARPITLPTDGTLYETELAHCSSCEPTLEAAERMRLEQLRLTTRRACLEVELLALEVERRRALAAQAIDKAPALNLAAWPMLNAPPQDNGATTLLTHVAHA